MARLMGLLAVAFLSSCVSAWPWPLHAGNVHGLKMQRQDNSISISLPASSTASPSSSLVAATPSATTGITSTPSSGLSTRDTTSAQDSVTDVSSAYPTSVDARLPPGGFNLITPAAVATSTYYKIGVDAVSFAWNYTSLSIKPSNIDVLVSCSANQATYTLAANASFDETGSVVWDTRPDQTGAAPLLTERYTLIIHDSAKAITDIPRAGQLGGYNQYVFGMYLPQQYTPRADWVCATCSGAVSDANRQAVCFMLGMSAITVFSFTWFVGGFAAILP